MVNQCPLCKIRVSEWMMINGKTELLFNEVFHKFCLIDYKLKHGKDYTLPVNGNWQKGLYET